MTTIHTRRPLWRRTWVRVTGSIAALALAGGVGAVGVALASPRVRPACPPCAARVGRGITSITAEIC